MEEVIIQLGIALILFFIGLIAGSINEKRHFKSLKKREQELTSILVVNLKKNPYRDKEILESRMVVGSAVISLDYFKRFIAGFVHFFGGEIKSYHSLLERARREALVRMKANSENADIILNTRIETSTIGNSAEQSKTIGSIEAIAYGTAIKYSGEKNG